MSESLDLQERAWPRKVQVFGVKLSVTDYDEVTDLMISAAERRDGFVADFISVDPLVGSTENPELLEAINSSELACPDGSPVKFAMNLLCQTKLKSRVCGPDTLTLLLKKLSDRDVRVFFYGSTEAVLQKIRERMETDFPKVQVCGTYSPPFRPITPEERSQIAKMLTDSGAQLIFVGLGAPRQSYFSRDLRRDVNAGFLCIGAAFDFLAGTEKRAPRWMMNIGCEWLFRLSGNPKRLLRRYTVTNAKYLRLLVSSYFFGQRQSNQHR